MIQHVVIANRDGLTEQSADIYIDATGDGNLFAFAGAPFSMSDLEDIQRSTLMFKFSHVNVDRIVAYAASLKEIERQDLDDSAVDAEMPDTVSFTPNNLGIFGFGKFIARFNAEAEAEGKPPPFPRKIVIALSGLVPGEYWMLITDVGGDASTAAGLTKLEIDARREAWRMIPYLKRVPGFEGAQLTQVASRVGVRETRHLAGEYVLTLEDVVEGREFNDRICKVGMPPEAHDTPREPFFRPMAITAERGMYDVPYRTLVPLEIDNLLVAGRCMSAEPLASASLRMGPVCLATGQAAGTASVLALQNDVTPRNLDVELLQSELRSDGVLI